jgi:amino acid transporter
MTRLSRVMSFRDLVLFNIVAIVGLRWIALAAAGGPSSLTLWVLALAVFFIPQGMAVTRLSSSYPEEGGIYVWTQRAFGPRYGFIAGWCYWANNVIYYPTLLVALAGFASFIGGSATRHLEGSTAYVVVFSLAVLWIALGFNILGLRVGRWVHNLGGLSTWIPGLLLVVFGFWAWARLGPANHIGLAELVPDVGSFDTVSFFANICFAFAGLELAAILGDEIREPRRNLQRAIVVAGIFITLIYVLGTWSLLVAVPVEGISIITGVLQAIDSVAARIGATGTGSFVALLLTLGGIGGVGAWLGGSARILYVAGLDRYLPPSLGKVHPRWGSPYVALVIQGIVASLFILVGNLGAAPQEAYLVLVDTTLIVYFIPYLFMFLSLIRLNPGGSDKRRGNVIYGVLGFLSVLLAIILALIPPADSASPGLYLLKVGGGTAAFVISAWVLYERVRAR